MSSMIITTENSLTEFGFIGNLAVDDQDVGHFSKLDTGWGFLNFFQKLSQHHLAPKRNKIQPFH